nr:MAG TPA: hypothetical protein [Caudoviricetes sp.]
MLIFSIFHHQPFFSKIKSTFYSAFLHIIINNKLEYFMKILTMYV